MRKLLLIVFFQLLIQQCKAQQYNTWYFGSGAGLTFNAGGTIPHALTDGINPANEGNASICDTLGNILFYTNGKTVFNRLHQVMLNGDNLTGHLSAAQSSLIVPFPNHDSIYYVFTTDAFENNFANGYRYSIVNMKHDNGKGEVVTKNILLNASCSERLTAARYANGIDVWIIGNEKNSNVYKAWLLTCTGLQTTPVVSVSGDPLNLNATMNIGVMKVSPDGKQLCQTYYAELDDLIPENFFQLFDFNNVTGILSGPKKIILPNCHYFGCEFSPDSKFLYVTRVRDSVVDQFEPKLPTDVAIIASRISISSTNGIYGIQLAPDAKIYLNSFRTSLSVISKPDVKGIGCTLEKNKIDLAGRLGMVSLPSAINDGPVDPYNNFIYQIVDSCRGVIQFSGQTNMSGVVQWTWDFGDGNTSAIQNPLHTFTPSNQFYYVKLTIRSSSACGYIMRAKSVAPQGASVKADFDFIAKCDSNYVRFINNSFIYPDSSVTFFWDFGDGNTSTDRDPVYSYNIAGTYQVKLALRSNSTCLNDSITKSIDLLQFVIHVSPDQIIDEGQSVQLNVTGGGTSFSWSPSTGLSDPHIQNPVATPISNTTYTVTALNEAGCRAVDSVFIKVNPTDGIFVPSAFTPNNDGKNDIFKPVMGFQFTLLDFSIYNRWGQRIFSTSQKGIGWNGKYRGGLQGSGVYVWMLKAVGGNNLLIEKKGTIALIR